MNDAVADLLADYPVTVERPVSWGEMDAFQHVNNARFFRYFEDARIAYFKRMNVFDRRGRWGNLAPILSLTSCDFKTPLVHPDTIHVGARVTEIEGARMTMEHAIASVDQERLAAVGEAVVVAYDYEAEQKANVPEMWHEAIEQLEDETDE
jgi:acyl-CoA thioester hydrolase